MGCPRQKNNSENLVPLSHRRSVVRTVTLRRAVLRSANTRLVQSRHSRTRLKSFYKMSRHADVVDRRQCAAALDLPGARSCWFAMRPGDVAVFVRHDTWQKCDRAHNPRGWYWKFRGLAGGCEDSVSETSSADQSCVRRRPSERLHSVSGMSDSLRAGLG